MGEISEKTLDILKQELNRMFEHRFFIGRQRLIPEEFYNKFREQYNGDKIIQMLKGDKITLGITNEDIYSNGLNFVFGIASKKSCLISTRRLDPKFYKQNENFELMMSRVIKESIHEIGHVFGMEHCKNEDCVMFYSNNIKSVDKKKRGFCDSCKIKMATRGIKI